MSTLHANPVVHYFDTLVHRIACGVLGFDRSTKHARAVNCPSCVELLRHAAERAVGGADVAARAR